MTSRHGVFSPRAGEGVFSASQPSTLNSLSRRSERRRVNHHRPPHNKTQSALANGGRSGTDPGNHSVCWSPMRPSKSRACRAEKRYTPARPPTLWSAATCRRFQSAEMSAHSKLSGKTRYGWPLRWLSRMLARNAAASNSGATGGRLRIEDGRPRGAMLPIYDSNGSFRVFRVFRGGCSVAPAGARPISPWAAFFRTSGP